MRGTLKPSPELDWIISERLTREMTRSNGAFAPRTHKAERARAYAIVLAVIGNSTLPRSDKARLINRIRIALVDDRRPPESIHREAKLVLDRVWGRPDHDHETQHCPVSSDCPPF
jgi:hypothetical protein